MDHPKVSVITPTTELRKPWGINIINNFQNQDYPNKELLIDREDGTIGEKRNRLIARATGDIIIHQDDDDRYKPDWITKSVEALMAPEVEVTGITNPYFYKSETGQAWQYKYGGGSAFVCGATMSYWKKVWEEQPFENQLHIGEDTHFLLNRTRTLNIAPHDYLDGFLASIHDGNTSRRLTDNTFNWRRLSEEEEVKLEKHWGYHRYGKY